MKHREVRIAHIADTHFDFRNDIDDVSDALAEMECCFDQYKPDLIVHAGDVFHRTSSVVERRVAAESLIALAEYAPVVGVRGNHDALGDLLILNKLRTRHPVRFFERPGEVVCLETASNACIAVHVMPWIDKAHFVSKVEDAWEEDAHSGRLQEAIDLLFHTLAGDVAESRQEGAVPIVVSHALVQGSVTSTGQTLTGHALECTPHAFRETGAAYVALGHVHKYQEWYDGQVCYSGSPTRQTFGEPEPKGWVGVTIADGVARSELYELPCKLRETVVAQFDADAKAWTLPDFSGGGKLRVMLTLSEDEGPRAGIIIDQLRRLAVERGAETVRVNAQVNRSGRVRAREILDARSTFERVRAYWSSRRIEPDEKTALAVERELIELEATHGEQYETDAGKN